MSEWIELNVIGCNDDVNPTSVRAYQIAAVIKTGDKSCTVSLDDEAKRYYQVAESYKNIMKKIQEVEETPAPVVERFTMEEYKFLLNTLETISISADGAGVKVGRKIIETLKEILEEDK